MAYLGRKGAAAPINASDIPDDSITSAKILADAVGSSDLAPDIVLTGGSVQIPSVSTANRPGESGGTNASQTATVGMMIYNTTLGIMQQYAASGWASIDSPPTVSSLNYPGDDTALDTVGEYNDATCDYNNDPTIAHDANSNMKAGMSVSGTGIPVGATIASVTSTTAFELSASTTGGAVTNGTLTFNTQTLIITGTNFQVGVTVTIDGTAPSTVTRNSSTQITVTGTPAKTAGTKVDGLVVTNISGLTASINVDYSPLPGWSSPASGNLGTLYIDSSAISTIALTGGADTTSYTLTNTLPPGLVMDTTDGDIDGTITGSVYTTYNFTVNAIDAQAQSSPRLFNIITAAPLPTGGTITTYTGFRVHIFTADATDGFVVNVATSMSILIVGGGGGGGGDHGGGGGGGSVLWIPTRTVAADSYTIDIGPGGTGATGAGSSANAGTSTIAFGETATGGGGGDSASSTGSNDGANGGGGSHSSAGGTGTAPSASADVTVYAGNDGGLSYDSYQKPAGGGGGSNAVGGNPASSEADGGTGGAGIQITNMGTAGATHYWAGGGGAGAYNTYGGPGGLGGAGGASSHSGNYGAAGASGFSAGVAGQTGSGSPGGAAGDNTGSGGGGGSYSEGTGGTGGSGIVIIRYAV